MANYNADAEILHDAMKGMGTDEAKLIAILGYRSRSELHQIDLAYRAKYGKMLVDTIKSEAGGKFGQILVNIIQPPAYTDATYLHDSLAGVGTNEKILNEIMATRDGAEMEAIRLAYVEIYRSGSEQAIKGDTSGKYEDILIALHNSPRGKGETSVNVAQAAKDAETLHQNPSETNFTFILGNASHAHIMAIKDIFQKNFGKALVDVIKKQFSGNFEDLLVVLVTPRHEYFADVAYKAMKGMGTDDDTLIRVITTRHGVDLPAIKTVFQAKYGKSLHDWVKSETSGDYQKIMLAIINQ